MVRYVRCIIANNNDIIVDVTTLAQIIVDQLHLKSYTSQSCIMTFYLDVLASPRYTRYSDSPSHTLPAHKLLTIMFKFISRQSFGKLIG